MRKAMTPERRVELLEIRMARAHRTIRILIAQNIKLLEMAGNPIILVDGRGMESGDANRS